MARGLNKVLIIGRAEHAPPIRYTESGRAISAFTVGTYHSLTTDSGEEQETDEWFTIVAWDELAVLAHSGIDRGLRVFVEGCLQTRAWEDTNSRQQSRPEVMASRLIPLDPTGWLASRESSAGNWSNSSCLNLAMAIGNLGRDPETRYTPDGQAVTSFSMAATHSWASADGARLEPTEWFNVVAWGSLAEICSQYLSKGRRVYVEGRLHTRGWEQANGRKHFRTELVASEMILLGPRPRNQSAVAEPLKRTETSPF